MIIGNLKFKVYFRVLYQFWIEDNLRTLNVAFDSPWYQPKWDAGPIKLDHDIAYIPALLRLNPSIQVLAFCYQVNFDFLIGFFRWFKFTLKPPYSIANDKLRLAIWDTSFWTFWLKFGHKGP